jgi:hypothetical protein
MQIGFWKRARAGLLIGVLSGLLVAPAPALAAAPQEPGRLAVPGEALAQFFGPGPCFGLGSGGLTGAGLLIGGLGQLYSLGAGGFYSPYYQPAYGSFGIGTVSGFLNFSGGQPSPLAFLAGSPFCVGLGLSGGVLSTAPFVLFDSGLPPFGPIPLGPGGFLRR